MSEHNEIVIDEWDLKLDKMIVELKTVKNQII